MRTFEHVVVAGCNGRFGRALAARLAPAAGRLTGIDRDAAAADPALLAEYVPGAIDEPGPTLLEHVARADCIMLCVPEAAVLGALGPLLATARADACIADIASVKTRIAARVGELGGAAGYVGLHPMFAPSEQFAGRNLVAVRIRENAATARLEALAATWEARISVLTAEEHDRLTACVQVVPHAALLAFGGALGAAGLAAGTTERLATPVHETMLSLLARVLRGPAETYFSIQTDNPYAAEARASLASALTELDGISSRDDADAFAGFLERVSSHLGDRFDSLAARSQRIVDSAAEPPDAEPPGER